MASAKIQRMSKSSRRKPSEIREQKASDVPEEIQCNVCKRRYEDPKLLPCLHTFCKACLEKEMERHSGILYCPVCPAEIGGPEFTEIDKLPSNFMISNLLQAIDLKQGLNSKQCDSCEEGVLASSRCFECSDFLCENCVNAHRRVRFTKTHRIVSLKNLSAEAMVKTPSCSTHLQETLKMYCKQCRKPVCRSCIRNEHEEHVLVSLKEAIDDTKPKINTLLVAARAKIPILQRKLKGIHASREKLENKVDEVIKEVQATSARILMAVKRREKDLYKMLRRIHDKKSDELESREQSLENDLVQVLDSCDFAEELMKNGQEGSVLQISEMTCARLRDLGERKVATVPEIREDEIEYSVDEKPVLDELKIYGKVQSIEQKSKQDKPKEAARKSKEVTKGSRDKTEGAKQMGEKADGGMKNESQENEKEDRKKTGIERKTSWLQTLANPRALIRRLSFGGDEMEERKHEEKSTNLKDEVPRCGKSASSDDNDSTTKDIAQENVGSERQKDTAGDKGGKQQEQADLRLTSEKTKTEKSDIEALYSVPYKPTSRQQDTQENEPRTLPKLPVRSTQRREESSREPSLTPPPNDPVPSFAEATSNSEPEYESPGSQSILKKPSTDDKRDALYEPLPTNSVQAWTVRGGSLPSGAHSQSFLASLCILTKNRRGRPREVEIQLESPDNSIVSAQILDHKNGLYTIFYCPLTPGEHNLYVNVGGKHIKHGKKVLNFYGKFGGMGGEELFLARRALSCIKWQVTPGFVELKDKKLRPNPDI